MYLSAVRKPLHRTVAALTICGILLQPACTTQDQRIGADDGSDVCRPQRVALDSTGDYFAEDIIKGAAIGTIGGGVIGALAGGNARSALFGALAGGAAGAIGGYWAARQRQYADQQTLLRTVSTDIERDNASIDRTQIAFDQLVACRHSEANRIRADLRAGRITRPQAEAAMAAVRQRSAVDLQIARSISTKIQGRSADFEFANAQVNPQAAAPPNAAPRRPARPAPSRPTTASIPQPARPATPAGQVEAATSTNLAKRDRFNNSITAAQANQSAFELS